MKTLFDPSSINSQVIKNRFLVAPMTRVSADLKGVPTMEMQEYYTAFAVGGFGGIITEGIYTDDHYARAYPNQPGLVHWTQVEAWKRITAKIRDQNALVIAQLMHAGSISQALAKTKAPSEIIPLGKKLGHYGGGDGPFPVPEAMGEDDIRQVINGFVSSAENALAAGFHGIELHAANGYLLDQFLTPYLNLRTDEYGGTMDNRFRVICEIIAGIRNQVPANFIVGLRISEGKVNNLAYRWEGGSKTAKALLHEIQKSPVDYLHIAAEHFGWEGECLYPDGSSLTGLAKEILDIPVIANGKMADLSLSQKLLDTEQADLFAIGKEALSNPDFVHKVANNMEIVPFDSRLLYPNPSLFSDQKYRKYLMHTTSLC
ncbi:NADH:flavin oxidoreductase [Negadavirga shengliensis]|uniref:NADH:flavin oxidoreductase n=1 Tax=Negadavirga shengliensis TaxID=1389218 RepID=A0ABV9T7S4_9BACT